MPAKPSSIPELLDTSSRNIRNSLLPTEPLSTPDTPVVRPTPEQLIATEIEIARLWQEGELPFLTHLEGSVDGSFEQFLCDYFHTNIRPSDWVLASHRCHYVYQLHGGTDLVEQVKRGRSMFLYGPRFINSAIVAGTCSIAVGLAMAVQQRGKGERIFCFLGDAATDHGHALEAIGYTAANNLPLRFIITDNNSSCGVTKEQRRGSDWDWQWPECVTHFRYKPKWPHAGSGIPMTLKPYQRR